MQYQADALFSINDRLGGGPGIDLPQLPHTWLYDLIEAENEKENPGDPVSAIEDLGLI